jgi:CDP-2,3-bis-(O-geranylgeranyl)-sn-glycerol synthase
MDGDFGLGVRWLLLLTAANSAPILAKKILGPAGAWPIDGGLRFVDGRPLLGPSKTWRGLASATLLCAACAPLLGFSAGAGAAAGALAMAGDALSSFVKRRLGVPSSGQAFGVDQVPEALLPLLLLRQALDIPWEVVAGVTLAFLLLETPVAWLAHRIGLRDRPY